MKWIAPGVLVVLAWCSPGLAAEWPQFRGPGGDGHAGSAKLPTDWSPTRNVSWRTEIPGLGWSSPVAARGKVYLTTAVAEGKDYSLRALSIDALSGKVLWNVEVFKQQAATAPGIHKKNSHASPTAVVDGDTVFVHFGHMGTACLNAKDGSTIWTQRSLAYKPVHGNGGSPILVGDRLIFSIDGTDRQVVVGLEKRTGKVAWTTPRNLSVRQPFSFSTPLHFTASGKEQLVSAGSGVVMSLDPKSGKELWRVKYDGGYSVVPKPVYGNGLVYVCTGYDSPTLLAIKPDGSGDVTSSHVAWMVKKSVSLNPSILLQGEDLYMVADNGMLSCLDALTGKVRWSERLGGTFSASILLAGEMLYLVDESGTVHVVKIGSIYEPAATNRMGERSLASPAVDGNALLLRTEKALYRIEKK